MIAVKWRNRLISLGAIVVIWEVYGRVADSLLMPTFFETIQAFLQLASGGELWQAFWVSNQALVLGYLVALGVGMTFGIAMGLSAAFDRVGSAYLGIMLMTPTSSLIPLILIAVGLNLSARAIIVFLFSAPLIAFNARAGLRETEPTLVEMSRSFGASRWQVLFQIIFPAALPSIIVGARVGLGRAVSGMVMAELLLIAVGLGRLLLTYQADFQAGKVYAVVLVILLEAVLLLKVTRWLERRLFPWANLA